MRKPGRLIWRCWTRNTPRLRKAVAGLKPVSLSFTPSTSKLSNLALICGVANHDVYHAGQIQLLKRLQA